MNQKQSLHYTCCPYVSEWSSGAAPASLCSVENIYCSVKWLSRLKGTVHPQLKNLMIYSPYMQMES